MKADDYPRAVQCFVEAMVKAEEFSLPSAEIERLSRALGTAYLDWARYLYWQARKSRSTDSCIMALDMASRAAEADPSLAHTVKHLSERLNKELEAIAYKSQINADLPDFNARSLQIHSLCRQAAILTESGLLDAARDKYEQVLVIDPYNYDAIRGLRKVTSKITEAGARRRDLVDKERLAEVEWHYVDAVTQRESRSLGIQDHPSLEDKLYSCVLQKIDFNETPLERVFRTLAGMISSGIKQDFSFRFDGFKPDGQDMPPVTFKADNIPAIEAVRALCKALNFNFELEKSTILIRRGNHNPQGPETTNP